MAEERSDRGSAGNGWKTIGDPPEGADGVHVRYTKDASGRWVVTGLYVHGPALTGETLRALRLARWEAHQNKPGAIDPGDADDDDLTLGQLRNRSADVAELMRERADHVKPTMRGGLGRPDGTDAFYEEVARAYKQYAEESRAPAAAIARETGVPVRTVHRWISEARRRGHLPAGRRGRVG
ncbi:helix-turn-helix domain-containing protein [Amycolatopsis dongchuanensis]|uniref:Helix-turn-helix DNA binding domain protein n=1 Tax=Amycolatopsis dongchuanensis TaxID=1070866 RepID=A0ABP8VJR7_9PSEU